MTPSPANPAVPSLGNPADAWAPIVAVMMAGVAEPTDAAPSTPTTNKPPVMALQATSYRAHPFSTPSASKIRQTAPLPMATKPTQLPPLPAQRVYVTDQLTTNLDWSTVELVGAGFNNMEFSISAERISYAITTNVDTDAYPIDFSTSFSEQSGLVAWTIESREPATGTWPRRYVRYVRRNSPLHGVEPPQAAMPSRTTPSIPAKTPMTALFGWSPEPTPPPPSPAP